jgi:site-specific recombinase XerD
MELLYQYEEYLSNYSRTTKETYIENVKLYLKFLKEYKGNAEAITICNVNKGDIYNYIAYMEHLSKNAKKVRLYSIKNFYEFLGLNLNNELFEGIKLYNSNIKMPYCLTWSQTKELINYYSDKRNKLIIYMFLTTGIRLNELAEIRIENIKNKIIKIQGKGDKERNVYINEKLSNMIHEYSEAPEGKLFNISRSTIQYIIKSALKKLGYKGSTHTLRHTAATIMYKQTNDILLVKEFLGHKSINSTQIYTHMNNETLRRAVDSNPLNV